MKRPASSRWMGVGIGGVSAPPTLAGLPGLVLAVSAWDRTRQRQRSSRPYPASILVAQHRASPW
jgi:hypothetical protein